ncbi:class IV adenylate cyclase [Breznakiellaceae bacterium SP9]
MSTEIELKAWVADPDAVKARLSEIAEYVGYVHKEDQYWTDRFANGVRVRNEEAAPANGTKTQSTIVTYKTKETRDGIEINDEHEFTVSNGGALEDLFLRIGLTPQFSKEKKGWTWKYNDTEGAQPITAELLDVHSLGYFAELEIVLETADDASIQQSRARLFDLLDTIGISRDKIETKYYAELLALKSSHPNAD